MTRRSIWICLCLIFCLAATATNAQDQAATPAEQTTEVAAERESPRAAMMAFLDAMNAIKAGQRERWPEVYALLSEATPSSENYFLLQRQAVKLKETLDYIGEVKPEELSGKDEAVGDFELYFPQVLNDTHEQAVRDIGRDDLYFGLMRTEASNGWFFMLGDLDELHKLLLENRTQQYDQRLANTTGKLIEQYMPDSLKRGDILGLIYWQWVLLFALILLAVVIDQTIRALLRSTILERLRRFERLPDSDVITQTVRPFGFVAAGLIVLFGMPFIGLPDMAYRFLSAAAAVFTVLACVLAAWKLVDFLAALAFTKAQQTQTKFDDILVPMIAKAAKIFAVAIGIVYGAQALNLPIVPLIGSLGIGSLAFAFAAKDTIENFFGSVAVILDKPFEVGDWVLIDGKTEGTVEELGFRSTRIRTFYNSQITVPNSTLVRATVDNYGRRKYRRWKTHIGVQYDTPPDKLIAFTEGIRELVRKHPYTRKDYYQVWLNQWSASSMDVLLYIFFEVPDWSTELRERERMFVDIVRLADKLGVEFAFPTQKVHLYKEEHASYETKHDTPGQSTDRRALVHGIRAARELVSNQPWIDDPPGAVSYSFDGVEILLDEAGNETLLEKEDKSEPTGAIEEANVADQGDAAADQQKPE